MNGPTTDNVVAMTGEVASYGGAIASVLTNFSISANKIPRGFEGNVNILNATVATLQQVSSHLKTETTSPTDMNEKQLLSQQGLKYVQLLAMQCAATFVRIPTIVADACLDRKELRVKRKAEKKALAKNAKKGDEKIHVDALNLDTAVFAENIENAKWICAAIPLEDVMQRLHEIQLHLLLVHQVISLGELSWIGSPNQVDIKSVVTYHERVLRTAGLIGIKAPGRHVKISYPSRYSSSDSDSLRSLNDSDSNSDSDSDLNSDLYDPSDHSPKKSKKLSPKSTSRPPPPPPSHRGPPPPPPLLHPIVRSFNHPRPPPANFSGELPLATVPMPVAPGPAPIVVLPGAASNSVNPPAYEAQIQGLVPCRHASMGSLNGGAVVPKSTKPMITAPQNVPVNQPWTSLPEKETSKESIPEPKDVRPPAPLEPRLFKTKTNGLGFKIKSFFRSKDSLSEEMKKALSDSDSHLRAFVLRGHETRLVPHSALHTLEATHMRTILSQLNDNTWYKTFTTLNPVEHAGMERLLHPFVLGQVQERNVVVLKVLEENKPSAWMVLLSDLLKTHPAPYGSHDRVILAIMREKLVDGKPLSPMSFGLRGMPPPPPPPGFGGPPLVIGMRPPPPPPPPGPPNHHQTTRTSDLALPPPLMPSPMPFSGPPPHPLLRRGPPPPPSSTTPIPSGDTLTEHEALLALTTYTSYTLRLIDTSPPGHPTSAISCWSRASITRGNSPQPLLLTRIAAFASKGRNTIETSLRMTLHQSQQIARIMDSLLLSERDALRFEWSWAEISLYNDAGEIGMGLMAQGGSVVKAAETASVIHVIAKRSVRREYRATDVHASLGMVASRGVGGQKPMWMGKNPPPPPPGPVVVDRRGRVVRTGFMAKGRKGGSVSSGSDSDSDSGGYESHVGERGLRMALRRDRARKMGRKVGRERERMRNKRRTGASESDSESNTGDESEDDVIQVKVELKRGDDVVQALLDLWTVQEKGKVVA